MIHRDVQEILRRPGARDIYKRLREAAWLAPFFESPDEALRALGARLLIEEMLVQLDPEYAARDADGLAEDIAVDARRCTRVEGRKRAAALWMAGCTYPDIARWLRISVGQAARWSQQGRGAL